MAPLSETNYTRNSSAGSCLSVPTVTAVVMIAAFCSLSDGLVVGICSKKLLHVGTLAGLTGTSLEVVIFFLLLRDDRSLIVDV